jgi:hypothetical protein
MQIQIPTRPDAAETWYLARTVSMGIVKYAYTNTAQENALLWAVPPQYRRANSIATSALRYSTNLFDS